MPDWFEQGKDHIWYPYTQMQDFPTPIRVASADGCKIKLDDGRELIDGIASWWSMCHGYSNPHIINCLSKQLNTLPNVMFAGTAHEGAYILASRLSKLTGLDRIFFTDSGSTAVETALKMAAQYWRNLGIKHKDKFVCFKDGYHGDTMGCMSLCDPNDGMHKTLGNYMPKQYSIQLPSDEYEFAEFEYLLRDNEKNIAAMIIEPLVQGAGGMKFHSPDILAEIYRICKKYDILFIADEILTGFGRTGSMFACNEAGITPDIMCLGKALTGGTMTLAATAATSTVFEGFLSDKLEHALMSGPTFMANPLAVSAANASLDLFEQNTRLKNIEDIEAFMYENLQSFEAYSKVKSTRVKGAIAVIEIDTNWDEIFAMRKSFIEEGVWLRPFGDIIYIAPPFTITKNEMSQIISAIHKVLQKTST